MTKKGWHKRQTKETVDSLFNENVTTLSSFVSDKDLYQIGRVISVGDGIAIIKGMHHAKAGEVISFRNGIKGMALNLLENEVGVVIFGNEKLIKQGDIVIRTNSLMFMPAGKNLLGRVVDVLGNPIDGKGPIEAPISFKPVAL